MLGITRTHLLSEEEKEQVAYHEAGQPLVAIAMPSGNLPYGNLPYKVTIVS